MTRTRVYTDQPLAAGVSVELGEDAAHHVSSVLRLRCGDPLVLFDGKGAECRGVIDRIGKRQVAVRIETHALIDRESPLKVTLAQGISRGERMDYTIQKAVELGVAAIVPLYTQRSTVKLDAERTEKRLAHWRKVIPSGLSEIQYEDLVTDREAATRRLLNFCGLPWEEQCLRPHSADRPVKTLSVSQVRREVYTSSVDRWRRYADHLGPLLAALGLDDAH